MQSSRKKAGGKVAIAFDMRFRGPDGKQYVGQKYYVYTKDKTVILSFQSSTAGIQAFRSDRNEILNALGIE